MHTTASAPASNAWRNAVRKSPGAAAAVVGNGASGAVIRCQNSSVVRLTPARKLSGPKLTTSGTTAMPAALATSGGRSLAESVTIATCDTVEAPPAGARAGSAVAGHCSDARWSRHRDRPGRAVPAGYA